MFVLIIDLVIFGGVFFFSNTRYNNIQAEHTCCCPHCRSCVEVRIKLLSVQYEDVEGPNDWVCLGPPNDYIRPCCGHWW